MIWRHKVNHTHFNKIPCVCQFRLIPHAIPCFPNTQSRGCPFPTQWHGCGKPPCLGFLASETELIQLLRVSYGEITACTELKTYHSDVSENHSRAASDVFKPLEALLAALWYQLNSSALCGCYDRFTDLHRLMSASGSRVCNSSTNRISEAHATPRPMRTQHCTRTTKYMKHTKPCQCYNIRDMARPEFRITFGDMVYSEAIPLYCVGSYYLVAIYWWLPRNTVHRNV